LTLRDGSVFPNEAIASHQRRVSTIVTDEAPVAPLASGRSRRLRRQGELGRLLLLPL